MDQIVSKKCFVTKLLLHNNNIDFAEKFIFVKEMVLFNTE